MTAWEEYPDTYRAEEVRRISQAVCTGECAALIGLSGSGKSNLVGFLAQRVMLPAACPRLVLVDCNRLASPDGRGFFRLLLERLAALGPAADPAPEPPSTADALAMLEARLEKVMELGRGVCFLLDRFDALFALPDWNLVAGNLRALRDAFKYRLTYVTAARRPLDPSSELAELFYGCTLWLGPLSDDDAHWSARRDARRYAAASLTPWSEEAIESLVRLSRGYPALLRAACEAYAAGAELNESALREHPAVTRRVAEFWNDQPTPDMLRAAHLEDHPWLQTQVKAAGSAISQPLSTLYSPASFDTTTLTAKELRLLETLMAHPNQVCDKDDLVQAVWPEDIIFAQGVRDESLAQLVRRLRLKIEPNPAEPRFIHTVPGRGYLFKP